MALEKISGAVSNGWNQIKEIPVKPTLQAGLSLLTCGTALGLAYKTVTITMAKIISNTSFSIYNSDVAVSMMNDPVVKELAGRAITDLVIYSVGCGTAAYVTYELIKNIIPTKLKTA